MRDHDLVALARTFDADTSDHVHTAISAWLRALIAEDRLPPGVVFPPERVLAEALGVSRMTLRQALASLREGGEITIKGGGGFRRTVVAGPRPTVNLSSLAGFRAQVLGSRLSVATDVLSTGVSRGPAAAREALRRPDGELFRIYRLRRVDGEPAALEDSYFPVDLLPGLLDLDLSGSMYDLLGEQYSLRPFTAQEEIQPVRPGPQEASLLGLEPGHNPLLKLTRTSWTVDNVPIEFSVDLFRTDNLRLVVTGRVHPS